MEDLPEGFRALPRDEQKRIVDTGEALGRFAFRRTTSVVIGPPPIGPTKINNGSGFVLTHRGRNYLVTASHVVAAWEQYSSTGEEYLFQVGGMLLDPVARLTWRDDRMDIAVLRLEQGEVQRIGIEPCEATRGWPPPRPAVDQYVLVVGFPGYRRERLSPQEVDFISLSFVARVAAVQEHCFSIQFERDYWVTTGTPIPPPNVDLGGLSGGPAFLLQDLAYPVIGVVSQHNSGYELMKVGSLAEAPLTFE